MSLGGVRATEKCLAPARVQAARLGQRPVLLCPFATPPASQQGVTSLTLEEKPRAVTFLHG